jgi:hypothetical protein
MIDSSREAARLFAPKPKTASTKHVHDANQAFEELGDTEEWRGAYYPIFKRAAKSFVDLSELKEQAKSGYTTKGEHIENKGKWFLQSARIVLGITKKPTT